MYKQLSTRRRLEKTIRGNGINVELYHAENSNEYKDFQSKLEDSLNKQIQSVATLRLVNSFLIFTKSNDPLVNHIGSYLKSIKDLIDFANFLMQMGERGGKGAVDKLGIDGVFTLSNPAVREFFDNRNNLIIQSVDNTTKDWIASKIQQGKDEKKTPQEIVDMLLADGKGLSKDRAKMIVLTETANALVSVEIEAYRRYDIQEIVWKTSIDDRVCPICLPLEGTVIKINGSFPDGIEHPPAHPNCRCFIQSVIPRDWKEPSPVWLGA